MWYPGGNERSLSRMFNHCIVEALRMRWLKRDRWKVSIALAGMLLLLVLMVWLPVSAVGAYEGTSGLATPVTVQATPTQDATVTALNKEKLAQEVQQLKNQNEPDPFGWLRTNASILLSTLVVVIGALFGFWRWRVGRRDAQDKDLKAQAEERFKTAVAALGDEKEGTQVGGAILLRSFLNKDDKKSYERFYTQVFDLAVAYLRLPRTPLPSEDPDGMPHSPEDPDNPPPLTMLSQALITVFKESFPLARDRLKEENPQFHLQSLDASLIQLDNAYLVGADLKQVWMPLASVRRVNLREADLSGAYLWGTDLGRANLPRANLTGANLTGANLWRADLRLADLGGADLGGAHLGGAHLDRVDLRRADLRRASLRLASPRSPKLFVVCNLEDAQSLIDTNLRGVKGLTREQLEACKAKGAIIDEGSAVNSSQSPVSPPPSSQSNDAQAPSAPPAQGSTLTPDTSGSGAASSQQGPES